MTPTTVEPPARRVWFTPAVCHVCFALLMAVSLLQGWRFLTHDCPLDLSGDEAQYWTWSKHLAWGYYSKGPLIAWIIRASCSVLGDTMPGVRAPALLLAVATSCCTYGLTRYLFGSDRLALGAVVLGAIVPMYAVGGTLMTIDPPMFCGWAVATWAVAVAVFGRRWWAWLLAGAAIGGAALAKYGALLWLPLVLAWLALDPAGRPRLRRPGPWAMVAVAMLAMVPPVIWNSRHGWVTVRHVSTQVGGENDVAATHGAMAVVRHVGHGIADGAGFVGVQVAAVNPVLCVFVVGGIVYAIRCRDPHRRQLRFLLVIGGGFWLLCLADNVFAKVQPNWPAPAYFTLLILTAHFIGTRWNGHWKPWRGWFWGAVVFGLVATTLARDATAMYPAVRWVNRHWPKRTGEPRLAAKNVDPAYKLRGIREPFAGTVDAELRKLSPGAFVLCEDYMDAAQLQFYLAGHPRTYYAGSYWTDPKVRRRWTQFDLWPDRQLEQARLFNLDSVYVGLATYPPLRQSFESVTRLPDVVERIDGLPVRTWQLYACRRFKGMRRPDDPGPR